MLLKFTTSFATLCLIAGVLYFSLTKPASDVEPKAVVLLDKTTAPSFEEKIETISILAETNPSQAISQLKTLIENEPTQMNQCHEIAHEIGHVAYKYMQEAAFTYKDPFCGGGYLHGLLEEATIFDESMSLTEIVHTVCSGEIEESCLHGLGHAIYKATQDIPVAIAHCDKVRSKNKDCYDGVYMELFDVEEYSEQISTKRALSICQEANSETLSSCVFYLPRILKQASPEEIASLCQTFHQSTEQAVCAQGSGVMFMKYANNFELESTLKTCELYEEKNLVLACETGVKSYFTYGNVSNTEW